MIKATVLFTYVDRYTGQQHQKGSVVELEESRAAELKALGAVDFAEGPKTEAKEAPKKEAPKKEAPKKEAPKKEASKKKATATKRTSK
jgi:hypothetical protein